MILRLEYPTGSTPLDPDEIKGLIPSISTQVELNIVEQANILDGKLWALNQKKDILQESFVRELHKKMYQDVWNWAGQYRTSQKSIGIDSAQISTQVYTLMKDVSTWIEYKSHSELEILARFHHKLVFIHPFSNGNGRYARLHTELLAKKIGFEIPTWGAKKLNGVLDKDSEMRKAYIKSLQEADSKKMTSLIEFLFS